MTVKRKPLSIEHKKKLSDAHKGKPTWNKGLLGYGKGHSVSTEARIKIGNATRGKTPWCKGKKLSTEICKKISKSRKGIKFSDEHKKKLSLAKIGEKNFNWKGGITPLNNAIRNSIEYKLWRISVFKRDNFQCIWGGKEHGKDIQADHIKPFAYFPELRFAIDNGRTLCRECHKTTETYGR